jgi:hypothetical protein
VGNLHCFHRLSIVNSAAINMGMQVSLLQPDSHSFAYNPRSTPNLAISFQMLQNE